MEEEASISSAGRIKTAVIIESPTLFGVFCAAAQKQYGREIESLV
jgi:CRISPR/Cas system CSM-associated protein Csm4 (group 5 of RAMP superfamily)